MMKTRLIAALLASCLCAAPALAADKVKIGFITTTSGPNGIIGKHMKDAADLALEKLGGKLGGRDAEIIYGDDQYKPDVGRQLAEQMLKQDKVDFVTGVILSSTLLAVYQPVIRAGKILISANAGPSQIAGKMCAPNFFTTSWQNDQTPEAMGKYMNDLKIDDVYVMAPNYAAGKDMVAGFKRYFKGRILNEVYTTFGQADYQAELSQLKAAKPKAVFVFYSGGMGIQFFKQYAQAGLRDIPLYSVFGADETTLPAIGEAAIGNYEAGFWNYDLDIPANREFVDAFRDKYGYIPSYYAAQSYDAINLINSAVEGVGGDVGNTEGMIAAMEKADFKSVRGPFQYNKNHFPIQNFYVFQITKDENGNLVRKTVKTVFEHHKDNYYNDCAMQ